MEGAGRSAWISALLALCFGGAPIFFPKGSSVDFLPGLCALHLFFLRCSKFWLPSTLTKQHWDLYWLAFELGAEGCGLLLVVEPSS